MNFFLFFRAKKKKYCLTDEEKKNMLNDSEEIFLYSVFRFSCQIRKLIVASGFYGFFFPLFFLEFSILMEYKLN